MYINKNCMNRIFCKNIRIRGFHKIAKPKLKRNREYWIAKIEENIARDIRDDKALRAQDWYVIHFWEKEVLKDTDGCISSIRELVESRREEWLDL